jgi:hypothetical protein
MEWQPSRTGSATTRSDGSTTTATPCRGLVPNHALEESTCGGRPHSCSTATSGRRLRTRFSFASYAPRQQFQVTRRIGISWLLSNVLAITCGVQRRQVHRLVGRHGSADLNHCSVSPLLELGVPHASKVGRLVLTTALQSIPDRKCEPRLAAKVRGNAANRQVRILQIILTENASMQSRTRGSIDS